MKSLKHALRVILAAIIGYTTIQFFHIKDFMLKTFYYFAVYIVISLILEMIFNYISEIQKKKNKEIT